MKVTIPLNKILLYAMTNLIQSLQSKLDQIRLMLTNSNKEAAIVGFTETWLANTTEKNVLQIEGYRLAACRDRTYNRWGGRCNGLCP